MHESRAERAIASAARHRHVDKVVVWQAVYTLLGYLNTFGGVRVTHTPFNSYAAIRMRFSWRRRYAVSLPGFGRAVLSAYGPLTTILTVLWLAGAVACALPLVWALLPVTVLVSCVLHEAGHCLALKWAHVPAVLLASLGYVAVAYVRPSGNVSRFIAAAGPCMAALPYVLSVAWLPVISLKCIAVAVAALHLSALLPYFADGKTLWRNI
jgi:hypothetical protein